LATTFLARAKPGGEFQQSQTKNSRKGMREEKRKLLQREKRAAQSRGHSVGRRRGEVVEEGNGGMVGIKRGHQGNKPGEYTGARVSSGIGAGKKGRQRKKSKPNSQLFQEVRNEFLGTTTRHK